MTRVVKIGNLKIGGKNPVAIKGMLKSPASNTRALAKEAKRLEKEGVQALRLAVRNRQEAKLASFLRKQVKVPLVADVHFHPQAAIAAIEEGFDCLRLNPLNIRKKSDVKKITQAAKQHRISIRIGVNSGGFKKGFSSSQALGRQMAQAAGAYLKILESEKFFDIMVSLKGSDIGSTITANRIFSKQFDYPIHLGITAAGPFLEGIIKSSIGLGSLLYEGIGNVIRVSLTAPSYWEARAAKSILQALNLRRFGPEVISCPTCSRCEVGLEAIVNRLKKELKRLNIDKPLRIAVMGCVVNGPGEAAQADIGAAFGKGKAAIFKKNKILCYSSESKVIKDLIKKIRGM